MLKTLRAAMLARDWFEEIRWQVLRVERAQADLEAMRLTLGAHGQRYEATGHGTAGDRVDAILAFVEAQTDLEIARIKLAAEIERATDVLYGRSGRGGLAKARCSADADCITGYYLLGYSWRQVADEMVRPDSRDGAQWCKRRAYRALTALDGFDMGDLADS